jgi:hypothetical protein
MGQVPCIDALDPGRKGGKGTGCSVNNERITPLACIYETRASVCRSRTESFVATLLVRSGSTGNAVTDVVTDRRGSNKPNILEHQKAQLRHPRGRETLQTEEIAASHTSGHHASHQ